MTEARTPSCPPAGTRRELSALLGAGELRAGPARQLHRPGPGRPALRHPLGSGRRRCGPPEGAPGGSPGARTRCLPQPARAGQHPLREVRPRWRRRCAVPEPGHRGGAVARGHLCWGAARQVGSALPGSSAGRDRLGCRSPSHRHGVQAHPAAVARSDPRRCPADVRLALPYRSTPASRASVSQLGNSESSRS